MSSNGHYKLQCSEEPSGWTIVDDSSSNVAAGNSDGFDDDRDEGIFIRGGSPPSQNPSIILASLLIPGRGDPVKDGALVYAGSKILWVGPQKKLPKDYQNSPCQTVSYLMPGLWDCHCHYSGNDITSDNVESIQYLPGMNALVGALTTEDLKETLKAGYTSIRELGGYAGDVKPAVEKGALIGPNIYSAHSALSITGGHGDDHLAPITTVKEAMCHGGTPLAVCDGVDECIRTVRGLIRRGASVIKVCSSGGVLSLNDDPEDRQFSDAELSAIVEEAARSRRAVAAHAIGKAGIMAALRAGVHSIEHGMYLDEEAAALLKEKGAYFIATQHIVRTLSEDYIDTLPPKIQAKLRVTAAKANESYKLAVRSGLKIALGTDMLSSDRKSKLSHGNNANELRWAVEAGMTPIQAIECATANGAETLGGLSPKSGQLKEGFDADFIVVKEDPTKDVAVLTNRKNILQVWKGGRQFVSREKTTRKVCQTFSQHVASQRSRIAGL